MKKVMVRRVLRALRAADRRRRDRGAVPAATMEMLEPRVLLSSTPLVPPLLDSAVGPQASITGLNDNAIASGDTTPSIDDGTDFGGVNPLLGATETYTLTNTGDSALTLSGGVQIGGTDASEFTVLTQPGVTSLDPGASTTFTIQFLPTASGLRTATVTLSSDDAATPAYTFDIQGTDPPGTLSVLGSNSTTIDGGDTTPSANDGTDFGSSAVGTGVSRTFTLTNTGEGTLTLSGDVQITGDDASEFTVTTKPAVSSLNPGQTATFVVQFKPTAAGLRSATVVVSSDDPDAPSYSFDVQGTGQPSSITITGNSAAIPDGQTTPLTSNVTDFGSTSAGTPIDETYTLTNSGSGTLNLADTPIQITGVNASDFTVLTPPGVATLGAGQSTTFTIRFAPGGTGLRAATVTVASDDANAPAYSFAVQGRLQPGTIQVQGNGAIINDGDTTPSAADGTDFGGVDPNIGVTQVFTITNIGTDPLTIGSTVNITGQNAVDFTVTAAPGATLLQPGDSTTFTVKFLPVGGSGVRTANLVVHSDDADTPDYTFAIQGTSQPATIQVQGNGKTIIDGDTSPSTTDDTDFGSTPSGTPVTEQFTLKNTGTGTLNLVGNIQITGANASDFTISVAPTSTSLQPGTSTTFTVQFSPTASGLRTATVVINSNDTNAPTYTFNIQGTTAPGPIQVQGNDTTIAVSDNTPSVEDSTNMGGAAVGQQITKTFTITNTGLGAVTLSGVTVSGANASEFSIVGPGDTALGAGASTTFQVVFTPTSAGLAYTAVTIASDDAANPSYAFLVEGSGYNAIEVQGNGHTILANDQLPETGDGTDFGSLNITDGSATQTFTIFNHGSTPLHLNTDTLASLTGNTTGDFSITQQPDATIAPGDNTTFKVTFNPSGAGTRSATVSIASDDPDQPAYTFIVQGTGVTGTASVIAGTDATNGPTIAAGNNTPTTENQTRFPAAAIGSPLAQTFTLKNTGTSPLGNISVQISGPAAGDFSVTQAPDTTLGASDTTAFIITFTPTAAGARSATLTVLSDDASTPSYAFAVEGSGLGQMQVLGDDADVPSGSTTADDSNFTDFGNIAATGQSGLTRTFTIQNLGGITLNLTGTPAVTVTGDDAFTLVQLPGTTALDPAGSTTFQVQFNPTTVGLHTATVTIPSSDPAQPSYTFTLQGTGVVGQVQVTGNSNAITNGESAPSRDNFTDFAQIGVDGPPSSATYTAPTSVTRTYTLTNSGGGALGIAGVAITGRNASDFSVTTQPATSVVPGSTTTFTITFNPSAAGTREAVVTLTTDDPDNPTYQFKIQGTGLNMVNVQSGTTFTGEQGVITQSGSGSLSEAGWNIGVLYTGYLTNGTVFDASSLHGNTPFNFAPGFGSVVQGWDQALANVQAGEKITLVIPSALGYGSSAQGSIPANSDLIFEVTVVSVTPPNASLAGPDGVALEANNTPSGADGTEFGPVAVGSNATHTFTLSNTTDPSYYRFSYAISGADASDFTVVAPTTNSAGNGTYYVISSSLGTATTFGVTFKPTHAGAEHATLILYTTDPGHASYTINLSGGGVSVAATDASAGEFGENPGTFTLYTAGLAAGTALDFQLSGTAAYGTDYTVTANGATLGPIDPKKHTGTLVLTAPADTITLTVNPIENNVVNPTRTVVLTLKPDTSRPATYQLSAGKSAAVNIVDGSPIVTVVATDPTASETGLNTATFTTSLTGNTDHDQTLSFQLTGTADLSRYTLQATGGTLGTIDPRTGKGTLTVPANTTSVTLTLTPVDDAAAQGTQTAVLTLLPGTTYLLSSSTKTATASILDNDGALALSLSRDTFAEDSGTAYLIVSRNVPARGSAALTVDLTSSDTDSATVPATVVIPAGKSSVKVPITLLDNNAVDGNRDVTFTVTDPSSAYANAQVTGTVLDGDKTAVGVALQSGPAAEAGNTAVFRITRADTAGFLDVAFKLTGSARPGVNYALQVDGQTLTGNTVTIPDGEDHVDVTVVGLDDQRASDDKTLTLTLRTGSGYAIDTAAASASTTVQDDAPQVSITAPDAAASESGDTGTFRVTLDHAVDYDVTVALKISGTAKNGRDDVAIGKSVTILAGQTSADITVTPRTDTASEQTETVIATLRTSRRAAYTIDTESGSATVQIADAAPPEGDVVDLLAAAVTGRPITTTAGNGSAPADKLSATIVNQGTAAATAFSVTFYATKTGLIDGSAVQLATTTVSGLAAGRTAKVNQTVSSQTIASLDAGSYFIVVTVTPAVGDGDVNAANDTLASLVSSIHVVA